MNLRFVKKYIWFLIVVATVTVSIWEVASLIEKSRSSTSGKYDPGGKPQRRLSSDKFFSTVHLDFKGAPPNLSYLKTILPKMAAAGCNALLIEYEDMFPYKGKLSNLSALNHYSPLQVRDLIGWAHDLGMQVIPLVQTFGHLESALKLPEWAHLREVQQYPSELCPSHPGSFALVTDMISQVMAYHHNSRFVHIGCDEVFHIGTCQRCHDRSLSPKALFEDHVTKLAKWMKERYPKVTPIIWDDMMRQWTPDDVANSRLGSYVVPMVWVYTKDVLKVVQAKWWIYSKVFPKIWVAAAFKGAGQPRSDFPHIEKRLANTESWLRLLDKSRKTHSTPGLVLTGWSRFDHFAVLCELLPVSLPSLLLNLLHVKARIDDTEVSTIRGSHLYEEWQEILGCTERVIPGEMNTTTGRAALFDCNWPGMDLYKSIFLLRQLKTKVKEAEHQLSERRGWITRYNVIHNFTNPARLIDEIVALGIHSLLRDIQKLQVDLFNQLVWYTDEYTAKEWIEDRVIPLTSSLTTFNALFNSMLTKTSWPRRPLITHIPALA